MAGFFARRLSLGSHGAYAALLVACILGPALLFGAVSWWSWSRVDREASADIVQRVNLLQEQSLRLLQVEQVLLREIDARVAGVSWPEIAGRQGEIQAVREPAAAEIPDVEGIFLADADGVPRLSSRPGVAPSGSISDRSYFAAVRDGAKFVVDGPYISRLSGERIIDVVRRLSSPDGRFRGAAIVVVQTRSLAESWKTVADPGDVIALFRSDGTILARYPELPLAADTPARRVNAGLMERINNAGNGLFDTTPSLVDGVARRLAFRKLGAYPLYISHAVDEANVTRQWYPIITAFGALTVAATLGLLIVALAVIRRARGEAAAHARAETTALALKASEESQRALFHHAPVAMHLLDAERRIIDVNARWLVLFGFRREDVVGRAVHDFYMADEPELRDVRWQEMLRAERLHDAERSCIRRNGEIFPAMVSATVVHDAEGRFARVITTVTDISARRRAEEAAHRERRFSELLIESSTEGIVGKDTALRFTVWNYVMEAMTGVTRARVLGRTSAELFPGFEGTPVEQAWQEALAGRPTALQEQHFAFPEGGREGHFDQTVSPVRDESGAIIGAIAFVRDISERRRIEEALRQAQKMEAVGQLTGGIAHDFNNLLTVILGNLETLERHTAGNAEMRRFTAAATRGAERAATLTQRLLAFSRRQPLDPRPLDPNRLVAGMSDLLRRTLGEHIVIETVLAGGLWQLSTDVNQLESALLNLAVNARDAMPDGGKLTIETANARLDEDYAVGHDDLAPGQYVMIAVSDTGIGMTPAVLAHAFEPFYTTKEVGRGSGLGLSQVYGFVKQSGGHVKIDSESGQGTTVRLYLPRLMAEVPPATTKRDDSAIPEAANGDTILLVEDDEPVREHTSRLLRELGYRVIEAPDGPAALHALGSGSHVTLLLTDVGLPGGLNGRELADEVVRRRRGIKVLFTTGYAGNAIIRAGRLDPQLHLIVKPFTSMGLATKVREVLDSV